MENEKEVLFFVILVYQLNQPAPIIKTNRQPFAGRTLLIANHPPHRGNHVTIRYLRMPLRNPWMNPYGAQTYLFLVV